MITTEANGVVGTHVNKESMVRRGIKSYMAHIANLGKGKYIGKRRGIEPNTERTRKHVKKSGLG